MGFDFDYNHAVVLAAAPGFLAAVVFSFLYILVDRPRYRDRYAGLVLGLGLIAVAGFGSPLAVAIFGPTVDDDVVAIWQWLVSIGIRGITSAFMCWLLWVYLTPSRARNRLGRYAPISREAHDATHNDGMGD